MKIDTSEQINKLTEMANMLAGYLDIDISKDINVTSNKSVEKTTDIDVSESQNQSEN